MEADIGEDRDLSTEYPELLQSMISEVEQWSHSHTELCWFYTREEGEQWKLNAMPRYEETFTVGMNH